MDYRLDKVLISKEEIQNKIKELGEQIAQDYKGEELICICVLTGAFVFLADMVRAIGREVDVKVDFMVISSYGSGTKSSGVVQIHKDLSNSIEGKHVLIIEDIIDSGLSLSYLLKLLGDRHPKSLNVCVCFDKPDRRKKEIETKYTGFVIPDEFVVGYGLDVAEKYRHLDALYSVKAVAE